MNDIQQRIEKKLANSAVFTLMSSFAEQVAHYPPAHIECNKPKREAAIIKVAEPLYAYHTVFSVPFNDYSSSVVLISNDVAAPFMAREVGAFVYHLEVFYNAIKQANNVQELSAYYKQFTLKPKQLADALVDDIKQYAELYGFNPDIKGIMTIMNYTKQKLVVENKV